MRKKAIDFISVSALSVVRSFGRTAPIQSAVRPDAVKLSTRKTHGKDTKLARQLLLLIVPQCDKEEVKKS